MVVERHYGESLAALPLLSKRQGVILDLGSGAGFPGFVLAVARPQVGVTLVEANGRKWSFLKSVCRSAALSSQCLNARVGATPIEGLPQRIDWITTRAVRFEDLGLPALLPRLVIGGSLLLWGGAENPALPSSLRIKQEIHLAGSINRRIVQIIKTSDALKGRMNRILAIANQKGGVGKTTTAINLGAAMAVLEKKVLLVDCDPQGNATRGLGVEVDETHLYHVLTDEVDPREAPQPTGFPFLDVIPAGRDLVGVEVEFVGLQGWQWRLARALNAVREDYSVILVDCPPSLGHLTINALVAADGVVVPLQCEFFALEGISALVSTIRRVKVTMNPRLSIAGIVLTMHDERTNLSKDVAKEVREHFSNLVYHTIVPRNVRLAEAPSYGVPVLAYDIKSRGAQAYMALAREMLGRARVGDPT